MDPLRWACVSGVKVTSSWPLFAGVRHGAAAHLAGLAGGPDGADGLLVPLVPALLVAETVKV